jgi:hypothetical protein
MTKLDKVLYRAAFKKSSKAKRRQILFDIYPMDTSPIPSDSLFIELCKVYLETYEKPLLPYYMLIRVPFYKEKD